MNSRLIYSPAYDFSLLGLERLHPFDAHKFSRAWAQVQEILGGTLPATWVQPETAISDADLLRVHTPEHLDSLRSSAVVAQALELGVARWVPNPLLHSRILAPMRLAVQGTVLATQYALDGGIAMNLGGGYHHAFRDHGEGFCIFADVAVAIEVQRSLGRLRRDDTVLVIDLDAHRGNGFESIAHDDPAVRVLDIYNFQIYPGLRPGEPDQHPFSIPVPSHTGSNDYLDIVREELARFLDAAGQPRLAFYNAGTDVVEGDPLGRMRVSEPAVAERDRYVVDTLASRGIPTAIVTSGGYSEASHRLIAQLAVHVARKSTAQDLTPGAFRAPKRPAPT